MTVEVLDPHGPCNGVKTAVAKALGLRDVYHLHELVHNEIIINRLKERGHRFVSSLDEIPSGATLVVSAHGTSPTVKEAAVARGLKIEDLTCPYVVRAHNVAREAAAKGIDVLVIGDRGHVEVKGVVGELAADGAAALDFESAMAGSGPIAVVAQTTLDIEFVDRLRHRLAERREIVAYSPPCAATRERQEAVRRFCREGGRAVLVLGSRKSANTMRLVAIAAECGASAFQATTIDEVRSLRGELSGFARLGVTAGASTPDEFVEESCRVLSAERIHGRASENEATDHALQTQGGTRSRASENEATDHALQTQGGTRSRASENDLVIRLVKDECQTVTLPVRHRPSHLSVLKRGGRPTILFVTVCVNDRVPLFDDIRMVDRLMTVWANADKWLIGHYVIMPDHVHFICAPNSTDCSFRAWMAYWKSQFSKAVNAVWDEMQRTRRSASLPESRSVFQRDCWDVQIRDVAHFAERVEYMRMNPVRKELVDKPEDWPNQGELNKIRWL